jgi:hypothetical protein
MQCQKTGCIILGLVRCEHGTAEVPWGCQLPSSKKKKVDKKELLSKIRAYDCDIWDEEAGPELPNPVRFDHPLFIRYHPLITGKHAEKVEGREETDMYSRRYSSFPASPPNIPSPAGNFPHSTCQQILKITAQ